MRKCRRSMWQPATFVRYSPAITDRRHVENLFIGFTPLLHLAPLCATVTQKNLACLRLVTENRRPSRYNSNLHAIFQSSTCTCTDCPIFLHLLFLLFVYYLSFIEAQISRNVTDDFSDHTPLYFRLRICIALYVVPSHVVFLRCYIKRDGYSQMRILDPRIFDQFRASARLENGYNDSSVYALFLPHFSVSFY